jgi:hypothetical protein
VFHEIINNRREMIKDTHEREQKRKIEEEKKKFSISNSESSHSYVFLFASLMFYFGCEASTDYLLLFDRSETNLRTLKNSK